MVFGYGSLIWKPGFAFLEQKPARLIRRAPSLASTRWSIAAPTKNPDWCWGSIAVGPVRASRSGWRRLSERKPVAYLREREQVTGVYREVIRSVWLQGDARQRVSALAYVADRSHDQYAGRLTMDEQLRLVRQGHGAYGPNDEYVIATVTALEAQGVRDAPLHRLAAMLHGEGALHRRTLIDTVTI